MSEKKILFFDVETTGLDPKQNGIIQLAYILTIGGKVVSKNNLKMKPFDNDVITDESLEINGMSRTDIATFPNPREVYRTFLTELNKYINKFDKTDKFYPCGYNVSFDLNFLAEWFIKNGNKYGIGSYCNWRRIDPLSILYVLDLRDNINLPNYKLQTVCDYFNIDINAHDALSDIQATQKLIYRLNQECYIFGGF